MNSKAKVVIAVICLVVAGLVVAKTNGLFGSGKPKRQGVTTNTTQTGGTTTTDQPADEAASPPAGQLKKDNF